MNEYFPFYEEWEPNGVIRNKQVLDEIAEGHYIWEHQHMIRTVTEGSSWEVADFRCANHDDPGSFLFHSDHLAARLR